jgi:hypothetical protein
MDLLGRIRVLLCAEDGNLACYGFGGQRVIIPAASAGAVVTVSRYRTGRTGHSRALLVLDREQRILLAAGGLWETYGEVARVCRAAGLPSPEHVRTVAVARSARGARSPAGKRSRRRSGVRVTRTVPRYQKAPGYRRLRTTPRTMPLRLLSTSVLFLLTMGLGVLLGVLPAVLLPEWFGTVRTLIGIVGAVLGVAGGSWLGAAIRHAAVNTLRWAVSSRAARTLAPPGRFFRRREPSARWQAFWTVALAGLIVGLVAWGPGVGIASLTHGLRDSALVAELRAHGVAGPGQLIDVPRYSTDSDGNTTETDVPTLRFFGQEVADPAIGGRPLPLDPDNPTGTSTLITVVFLPLDPGIAAAKQQITGSVWHGTPTANLISGSLLTLALPAAVWGFLVRVRRLRRRKNGKLLDDLSPA